MKFKGIAGLMIGHIDFQNGVIDVTNDRDKTFLIEHRLFGTMFSCITDDGEDIKVESFLEKEENPRAIKEDDAETSIPKDNYDPMIKSQLLDLARNRGYGGNGQITVVKLRNWLRDLDKKEWEDKTE